MVASPCHLFNLFYRGIHNKKVHQFENFGQVEMTIYIPIDCSCESTHSGDPRSYLVDRNSYSTTE